MQTKTRAPIGSERSVREYQAPPPAETKPYLRASSHERVLESSPNETYQSWPFHGSRFAPPFFFGPSPVDPLASSTSHVRARYSRSPSTKYRKKRTFNGTSNRLRYSTMRAVAGSTSEATTV